MRARGMLHAGANGPQGMQAVVGNASAEPGSPPEAAWTTMFMCSHATLTGWGCRMCIRATAAHQGPKSCTCQHFLCRTSSMSPGTSHTMKMMKAPFCPGSNTQNQPHLQARAAGRCRRPLPLTKCWPTTSTLMVAEQHLASDECWLQLTSCQKVNRRALLWTF